MKVLGAISTVSLSLIIGIGAPACAQQDRQEEKQGHQQQDKHEQGQRGQGKHENAQQRQDQNNQQRAQQQRGNQQHAQQQPRDQNNQQRAQQQRQDQNNQGRAQRQRQDQNDNQRAQQQRQGQNNQQRAQQQRGNQQPQRRAEQYRGRQTAWHEHRAQSWQSDHRTWGQRGGYRGYRIPEQRFRSYFGSNHGFRISGRPFLVVGGYPRFQYSGYWFSLVDPWPEYWADNWYDTDDVFVVYADNGYYLHNRRYPDVGIAISISL